MQSASRAVVRRFSAAVKSKKNKLDVAYTPVDKAAISPMRGLFYGDLASYQKHMVPFPSALNAEQTEMLRQMVDPVRDFMATVPSAQIDEQHKIPEEVLQGLRDLGLWGIQIPEHLGGLGLTNTAYARLAEEIAVDSSVAVTLMAHQSIGLKGILLCGTEEQKAKYLPKLASGEHVAAFALTEPGTGSDAASIKLTATPVEGGKAWVLNGQKMWISNGGTAQIYTLFARTVDETGQNKVTAFIVDKSFGGITPGPPEKKLGIRGSNTCVVTFDNCRVPAENILGDVHKGFYVAMKILNNGRFGMGAATGGGLRKLIGLAADYANNRIQFGQPIANFGLIREKFARMALDAYAIESMAYATTAMIDAGVEAEIEAAACKVYGSEALFAGINDCIQILGGMGFSAGGAYPFERMMRDSRILLIFEGTNEILRLFIALTCMKGPGAELKHLLGQLRSPAGIATALPELLSTMARAKLGLGLPEVKGLAPELAAESAAFVKATAAFQDGILALLQRYGSKLIEPDNQMAVQRAANAAIDLYGWMAVMSRCSAALHGPHKAAHPQHELLLAKTWISKAKGRIASNVAGMKASSQSNGDAAITKIAAESLGAAKYLADHPLRV